MFRVASRQRESKIIHGVKMIILLVLMIPFLWVYGAVATWTLVCLIEKEIDYAGILLAFPIWPIILPFAVVESILRIERYKRSGVI